MIPKIYKEKIAYEDGYELEQFKEDTGKWHDLIEEPTFNCKNIYRIKEPPQYKNKLGELPLNILFLILPSLITTLPLFS